MNKNERFHTEESCKGKKKKRQRNFGRSNSAQNIAKIEPSTYPIHTPINNLNINLFYI